MERALPEISKNCRNKAISNFFVNSLIMGNERRRALLEEKGFKPPFFFVLSPTMAYNLSCYGCYAGEYAQESGLPYSLLNRLLNEARNMGIYFVTISGGEPFIRRDLIDLFAEFDDMYFQVYTNGTLIDVEMAKKLARLGNVLPCINVEGFEKETDDRRGKGTYSRIMAAMDNLRSEGVLFGFSATATRSNNEFLVSDQFIDFYIQKGCFLGWYFNGIPIGRRPDLQLMPTPAQRQWRLERLNSMRDSKPILLADFWNDGPLTGGCLAGGRCYFHINNNGDVEPCVFTHFAVDNIKEKSLLEVLDSNMFQAIRKRQPYSDNLLRPCMIIDHPNVLREIVAENGAHPTHHGAETIITDLAEALDQYAEEFSKLVDPVWCGKRVDAVPTV
jgi:MoaA/NifB/PqqE/SkfB family radical SAM enzyme